MNKHVKMQSRPQLQAMLRHVRKGDEVVVHSMDRLACSLVDLRPTIDELTIKGVRVRFLKEGLTFGDISDPCAALMFSAMEAGRRLRTRPAAGASARGHRHRHEDLSGLEGVAERRTSRCHRSADG
jgi:Resolvase, N terminal domain